jgi:hypothetical protein
MGKVTIAVAVELTDAAPDDRTVSSDAGAKALVADVLKRAARNCPKAWNVGGWQVKTLSRTVAAKARHARNRKGKK